MLRPEQSRTVVHAACYSSEAVVKLKLCALQNSVHRSSVEWEIVCLCLFLGLS